MNQDTNFDDLSKAECLDLVEQYRSATNASEVGLAVDQIPHFTTKKDAVEWLEGARKNVGIPDVKDDQSVTIIPANSAELTPPPAPPVAQQPPADPVPPASATISTAPAPKQLFYNRRPVVSINNKLSNGRVYKEVVCADSVALLSQAEFDMYVKEHNG